MPRGRNDELYEGIPQTLDFDIDSIGRDIDDGPADPEDGEAKDPQNEQLMSELKKLGDSVQQGQSMGALLADPQIQQYLAARQQGKPIKLVEDEPEATPDPFDQLVPNQPEGGSGDDLDLEELDNQQLIQHTVKTTTQAIMGQLAPLLKQVKSEMAAQLEQQQEALGGVIRHLSLNQVDQAKAKYPDFEQYKGKMAELSKLRDETGRALPIDELYRMAKAMQSTDVTAESEKPTTPPRRGSSEPSSGGIKRRGRKGFEDMLSEALAGEQIGDQFAAAYGAKAASTDIPI